MKRTVFFVALLWICNVYSQSNVYSKFPDGSSVGKWFKSNRKITPDQFKKQYKITDFGVKADSSLLQTTEIQKVIDMAAERGGGLVIIPPGVYLTGALFFKPKTALYLEEGAVLKGSDNIADYPLIASRMEGQNLDYFAALVNAYGVDGFSISGKGTINGNGLNFWKAFWKRREENRNCTNLEVSRPRLVFVWKCNNVQFQDVKLINSGFWTNHFYQCNNIKLLNLYIYSPHSPVKAPSTDAIDIDVCRNVHIQGCYLSVNDDAIALKGGKGPRADQDKQNGMNCNIIIENCTFGFCHSALTCGSEAIHNRNVMMRNCTVENAQRMFWLKMREDTPQLYEYITIENISGSASRLFCAGVWSQFFNLKGETDRPRSAGKDITLRNINFKCDTFFELKAGKFNSLSDITFENLSVDTKNETFNRNFIENLKIKNVIVNGNPLE
jgi:polygalacturonase